MGDSRTKISICIATYNQERYIEDCLLSVLAQSCDAEMEILVGDDRSTDSTTHIIQRISASCPGRLQAPNRGANLGGPHNYKDLVSRATGDYIAHLDGDDYWLPGKLAAQLSFMRTHSTCAAVYTNATVIDEGGRKIGTFNNCQPPVFGRRYLLWGGNFLNHSSILYRSEFKDAVLGVDGEFIDYQMHIRLSGYGDLGYVNEHLVAYRKGSITSSLRNSPERVLKLTWQAMRDTDGVRAGLTHGMARFLVYVIYVQLRDGRVGRAIGWCRLIAKEAGSRTPGVFVIGALELLLAMMQFMRRKTGIAGPRNGMILHRR